MIEKHMIPNFKNIRPTLIQISSERVKKSRYYAPDIESKPPKDRFKIAFDKLIRGDQLFSRDYKILLFYLNEVEQQYSFKKLYDSFNMKIDTFKSYRGFVRPMTSYIYNHYDRYENIRYIYKSLRFVTTKLKENNKYTIIKSLTNKNITNMDFLSDVKNQFYSIEEQSEIDNLLKKLFMSRSDKFYLKCMVKFIVDNHLEIKFIDEFKQIVSRMDLETKKEVFREILRIYSLELDIDKYPNIWFDMISKYLGEPYSQVNNKWIGIDEELKETFRRWNNSKHLYEFFNKTVIGGDQERLRFWKQYIDSIYRIRYFEELDNALVMEFRNDVFVEFAKKGNALYFYNKRVQNIDNISMKLQNNSMSKNQKIRYLKDPDLGNKRNHMLGWQYKFEKELKRLNYEKGGW